MFNHAEQTQYDNFLRRHGGNPVKIKDNFSLLPDGAAMEELWTGGRRLIEPPPAARQRLGGRKRYCEKVLEICTDHARRLKSALLGGEKYRWDWDIHDLLGSPPDAADGQATLLFLKSVIEGYKKTLAAIEAEIEALPEVVAERRRAAEALAFQERDQATAFARAAEIQAIEV